MLKCTFSHVHLIHASPSSSCIFYCMPAIGKCLTAFWVLRWALAGVKKCLPAPTFSKQAKCNHNVSSSKSPSIYQFTFLPPPLFTEWYGFIHAICSFLSLELTLFATLSVPHVFLVAALVRLNQHFNFFSCQFCPVLSQIEPIDHVVVYVSCAQHYLKLFCWFWLYMQVWWNISVCKIWIVFQAPGFSIVNYGDQRPKSWFY